MTAKTASLLLIAMHTAGSLSMGVGEYISVASQRDIEEADVQKERNAQQSGPESRASELEELVQIYVDRGLQVELARQVALQLTHHDVIRTHARDELGIDIDGLTNPLTAALASTARSIIHAFKNPFRFPSYEPCARRIRAD